MSRSMNLFSLIIAVFLLLLNATFLQAQNKALAIFNLRPANIEAMGSNTELLYAMVLALEKEESIELMPRREMEEILFHAGLVQGDNPDSVLKAGQALSLDFIFFGHVIKKDGNIQANLKLMDIQNKRVIKTWSPIFSGRETMLNQIPSIAEEVNSAIFNKKQSRKTQPAIDIENIKASSYEKKVVLTWKFDNSLPIISFHIYRSENHEGPYQFLGRTNNTIFNDTKIKKGKSYYYQVGIILDSGQEIKTKHIIQVKHVGEKQPYPPLIMSGKGYVKRVEIKFIPSLLNEQENFKIKQYKIYRQKNSDDKWEKIFTIDSRTKLTFIIEDNKNIKDDETYTYRISSLDKKKRESQFSDPISLKTINCPVLTIAQDNLLRKIDFVWTPLENVEGYYLYKKIDLKGWEKIARIKDASNFRFTDVKNLKDGKRYQYRLTAYDTKAETEYSNVVEAKTKDLPQSPNNFRVQSGLVKSVKISWTPVEDTDVGGYAVYRGTSKQALAKIAEIKGYKSNFFLDKGAGLTSIEDGMAYYYAITSFNIFGVEGQLSQAAHAKTKPRPGNAKGLVVTAGHNHIFIKWNKNPESDIKTYVLYRKQGEGFWSKIRQIGPDQTSYMDNDLQPEKSYSYRIIIEDSDNLKSDPVESVSVKSPTTY